jgi:hypothetical protein
MKDTLLKLKTFKVFRLTTTLAQVPLSYLKEITWENDQAYGFAYARQLWGAGWMGKCGLLLLLLAVLASALLLGNLPAQAETGEAVIPLPILGAGLLMYAIGWGFAQAVAVDLPLWGFALLSVYLSWYGLLIGGSLAGSLGFALPTLWIFILGLRLVAASQGRMRWLILGLLCLGAGQLTFGSLGLGKIVPQVYNELGRWCLGLVYLILSTLLLRMPLLPPRRPSAGFTFCGTLLVSGTYFGLAFARDAQGTAGNALLAFQGLLGFVDLFWFWLGWTLLEGFLTTGAWGVRETRRLFSWSWFPAALPFAWLLAALGAWWLTGNPPLLLMVWSHHLGLDTWVYSWSLPLYFTVHDLVLPSLILFGVYLASRVTHRYSAQRTANLHGVWIALILSLYGFYECLAAFATLEEDAAFEPGVWAALLLGGGIVWELARSGAAYWESESRTRQYALTAFLLIMVVISTVTLSARLPDLVKEYTLYSFLGVVYLGLPLSLFTLLPQWVDYEPPGGWGLLGLFGLGIASAVLVLGINPQPGLHLGLAPLVWVIALALWGRKLGRLEQPLDGLLAGSALGLGFVTFWMSPEMLLVPFLKPLNDWQLRYLLLDLQRPLLLSGQLWFTLGGIGVGMLCGWVFTKRKKDKAG